MFRKLLLLFLVVVLGVMAFPFSVQAQQMTHGVFKVGDNRYTIDNVIYSMDVSPFIENGRVYVPLRYLAHMLLPEGEGVIWDAQDLTVTLEKPGITLRLQVGNPIMYRSPGISIPMDVAPVIYYDRVFLPARYVAEQFGYQVEWVPQTREVHIRSSVIYPVQPQVTAPILDLENKAVRGERDETPIPPYKWEYKGGTWTWAPPIPQYMVESVLEYYRNYKPHPHSSQYDYILTYCMDKDSSAVLSKVAEVMRSGARNSGFAEREIPYIVIAFVQSLEYVSDSISAGYDEYPRYPIETLLERKGDCEDTAMLTAVLLRHLGYGAALIFFDDHCAVGVKGDPSIEGYYFEVNNTRYYYLETTDVGWQIGQMPEELKDKKAIVIPLP